MLFRKILVANRGEIAVRIVRGCHELGIPAVAVYSDPDRAALHVRVADEAAHLGASPAADSYLNIERILEAARRHGADAIHPGYGFLSENADFAAACENTGITFIGPSAATIRVMGSKIRARAVAREAKVPVLGGTDAPVTDAADARSIAAAIGYPVLIKADAGGGGKGMRRVDSEAELDAALRDAGSEAERSFRSAAVYIEKLLERPRHLEVQVFGDCGGNLVHLGVRECSLQRRHQKVVEETPSPLLARYPGLQRRMGEAAVRIAKAAGYYNAGTAEFLVDENGQFYFLEMNTRLQVEHPVTELVTGFDLVHWQVRVAAGERLPVTQADVAWRGAAIECRLYAEDPEQNFFPSPGTITSLSIPTGPGVRLDSGVYPGWFVPVDYDPLLAKLAVWAETREMALSRMKRALDETHIGGIATNVAMFRELMRDQKFRAGEIYTGYLQKWLSERMEASDYPDCENAVALAAALQTGTAGERMPTVGSASRWLANGRQSNLR